ncbi:MAG: hypothetical protein OXU20_29285, partial [Myxococcales bacterium]|nr:hypothetical protein [Myxococcales bacterium]
RPLPGPAERERIRNACRNRLNWSDGGHWIGSGAAPNCFGSSHISGTHEIVFSFPTDAAAFNWNASWEKAIRYGGHFATAVLTVIAARFAGPFGVAAGTFAAILKDEFQAAAQYPRVARGWRYIASFHYSIAWNAHPWGKSAFYQEASGASYDLSRALRFRTVSCTEFELGNFPEAVAVALASTSKRQMVAYR